jgi:hypothetical protein
LVKQMVEMITARPGSRRIAFLHGAHHGFLIVCRGRSSSALLIDYTR